MELSKKKQRLIDDLINVAQRSDMHSLHGAAIVRNSKVLAYGNNSRRMCINGSYVASTHAEISVLFKALRAEKSAQCKLF